MWGPVLLCSKKGGQKLRAKIEAARVCRQRCMQVKTEMKHMVGKEPEGGSKLRKEVGNESHLTSMFQKQQTTNDSEARETYNAILEKGKQLGFDEAAHAEPVCRSENDTHPAELMLSFLKRINSSVVGNAWLFIMNR